MDCCEQRYLFRYHTNLTLFQVFPFLIGVLIGFPESRNLSSFPQRQDRIFTVSLELLQAAFQINSSDLVTSTSGSRSFCGGFLPLESWSQPKKCNLNLDVISERSRWYVKDSGLQSPIFTGFTSIPPFETRPV